MIRTAGDVTFLVFTRVSEDTLHAITIDRVLEMQEVFDDLREGDGFVAGYRFSYTEIVVRSDTSDQTYTLPAKERIAELFSG